MDTGYLRFPSIAGETVIFSCEDDLWSVDAAGGTARRLTAGAAEASWPLLSPDGGLIAFTGAEEGPSEIYVMPRCGGPALRLTYQGAQRCWPVAWEPRTGEIVYASTAEQPPGFGPRLFAVHPEGGGPRRLPYGSATGLAYGPDADVVVCRNGAEPARWKRYRGGAAGELWAADTADTAFRELLRLPGNIAHPCRAGGRLYFVADHEGTGSVYSCDSAGRDLRRHAGHRDFYARGLRSDGARLVYHAGGRLYLLEQGSQARPLAVSMASSRAQRGRRHVPAAEYLDDFRLSPDGSRLAVTARGAVFTMAHWSGAARRLGRPEGIRYRLASWLSDGRRLAAVAADESPDEWLVLLDAETGTETDMPVGDVGIVTELAAAPRAALLAFATNRQRLYVADADTGLVRMVDRAEHDRIEDLAWSSDGRWLAYTYPETPRSSAIRVAEAAAGTVVQLTRPVVRDTRPCFDPGGRYLYFIGQRALTAEPDQVQGTIAFPYGTLPYAVVLRADGTAPFVPRPVVPGAEPELEADPSAEVVIDVAGIEDRVVPFPVPESRYLAVAGVRGGKALLWHKTPAADPLRSGQGTGGRVSLVDVERADVTECLARVDEMHVCAAAGVLAYRSGERLRVLPAALGSGVSAESAPGRASGWVDMDRLRVPVRPRAEWPQMFREAWRLQRENFWGSEMAGVDWPAVYQRYRPLVELVASRSELSDLIVELQGELGTSHAYERGGDYRDSPRHPQGFLGVDWVPGDPKTWRVASVLRGDPWHPESAPPCARPGVGIRPGDAVLAVDGLAVGPHGPGELLVGLAGQEVELTVRSPGGEPRRVCLRATDDEGPARYRDWANRNRGLVRRVSGGRLGYLHVPDMREAGYTDFVRGFLGELDRAGLVVDIRFNTGGHASALLLEKLARRRLGAEHGRWSGVQPVPAIAPRGPMVLLVNEHTGSDGEIFSHLFRALGLGPVVGQRTWGGVVAVWPRHWLADGTVTTQPEFRFVFDGVGALENHGVEPDLPVPVPLPETDDDPQLCAAARHLLTLLPEAG